MTAVSLIIRTWNCREALQDCLAGLAGQRFRDFETIVVDSGSTDGTAEAAEAAGVRLLRRTARSFRYGDTLNLGFREAASPILGALSAHSILLDPEALGRLAAALRQADDRVAAVYGCAVFSETEARQPPADAKPLRVTAEQFTQSCDRGLSNSCSLIRRDLWEAHPFPAERCEDQRWAAHFLDRGYATLQLPSVRYRYRLDRPWSYYVRKHRDDLLMLHRTWPAAAWPKSALTDAAKVRYRFWHVCARLRCAGWRWERLSDKQKWWAAQELGLFLASARTRGGRFWGGVAAADMARALLRPARQKGWFLVSEEWP